MELCNPPRMIVHLVALKIDVPMRKLKEIRKGDKGSLIVEGNADTN